GDVGGGGAACFAKSVIGQRRGGERAGVRGREGEVGRQRKVAGGVAGADAVVVDGRGRESGKRGGVALHQRGHEGGRGAVGGGGSVLHLRVGGLVGRPSHR